VRIDVSQQIKQTYLDLGDEEFLDVDFELAKLSETGPLQKERIAILNDKYDVYVFRTSKQNVVVVHEPGRDNAVLADLVRAAPTAHSAANSCARALNITMLSVHVIDRS
jgi:hypothetical protein